jgi:cation:H+ antiporter
LKKTEIFTKLSPSIHKFDDVFIYSIGLESFDLEALDRLMTAIAAIRKGHPEITVRNIVGANVLNCLFVIGAAAAVRPLSIPPNFYSFHLPAMLIILYSFRYFIFRSRDGHFKRTQGAWLLGVYLVYLILQCVLNIGTAGR